MLVSVGGYLVDGTNRTPLNPAVIRPNHTIYKVPWFNGQQPMVHKGIFVKTISIELVV